MNTYYEYSVVKLQELKQEAYNELDIIKSDFLDAERRVKAIEAALHEKRVVPMTLAEIEKKLGHKVLVKHKTVVSI